MLARNGPKSMYSVSRHGEVDDDESDRQNRHQAEEGGHLTGRPVGGLLVDVGQPGQVLGSRPGSGTGYALFVDCHNLGAGLGRGLYPSLTWPSPPSPQSRWQRTSSYLDR